MEALIQQLMEKHNLSPNEAREAISLVAEYLKEQHPVFKKLIDETITNDGKQAQES